MTCLRHGLRWPYYAGNVCVWDILLCLQGYSQISNKYLRLLELSSRAEQTRRSGWCHGEVTHSVSVCVCEHVAVSWRCMSGCTRFVDGCLGCLCAWLLWSLIASPDSEWSARQFPFSRGLHRSVWCNSWSSDVSAASVAHRRSGGDSSRELVSFRFGSFFSFVRACMWSACNVDARWKA